MNRMARTGVRIAMLLGCLMACMPALGTSAQMELSEPVLVLSDNQVHGRISFELLLSGDVYDTAGNVGATFPLGNINHGRLYFHGDIFTWVENPKASQFDPRRAVYTFEPGYYWESGGNGYRLFVKHQSYHDVDFTDGIDEGYELYGFGYRMLRVPGLQASVGKYLNTNDVDYDWDFAASATFPLAPGSRYEPYFHTWLHHVTEKDGPAGRDGFTDFAEELGLRYSTGVIVFARYEFLHDIDRFAGRSDHHVMTGIRYTW